MTVNFCNYSVYEGEVPDADCEIALKVIRTARNACLGPGFFDADGAVILSHAHAKLVELIKMVEEEEELSPEGEQDEHL